MAKSTGTTGLDIQRNYICVAQYSVRDASVRHVTVQPLPVAADVGGDAFWGAVALELRGIRKKVRFPGADIICSLPCDTAVIRALEAESDERDQGEILRWELAAGLPGSIDEYAYDFYEVDPGHLVDRRRYLAAAVRKETITKLKRAVSGVKLNPYIIDIDLFALSNVFQTNYRERLGEASILVHAELRRTKLMLVYNSSYVDYRIVDFDAESAGADAYAAMLRDEAARLISSSHSLVNLSLEDDDVPVYIAGSLFTDREFSSSSQSVIRKCELLDPFKKIGQEAGMTAEQIGMYSPQLAVAVGLALRGGDEDAV